MITPDTWGGHQQPRTCVLASQRYKTLLQLAQLLRQHRTSPQHHVGHHEECRMPVEVARAALKVARRRPAYLQAKTS
jgi:hypothetical protein